MTSRPTINIPQPCSVSWAAMSPTAAGRHCAACATEVVDFTRLSEAEVLALLARQGGRPVCANAYTTQLAPAPMGRWRQWLLAGLAVLGWHPLSSCASKPPQQPPTAPVAAVADPAAAQQPIVIRGQVLDGESGPAVAGAFIIINETPYGAVTDENGRFELVLATTWAPVQAGTLTLHIAGSPFDFKPQAVPVNVRTAIQPIELKIKLQSTEGRGRIMGKIRQPEPPVKPPLN